MKEFFFSEAVIREAVVVLSVIVAGFLCVCMAVAVDLRSGVRKARYEGRGLTSGGFRRTVRKLGDYMVVMTGMAVVDLLYVWAAMMLRATGGLSLPSFPFLSAVGALLICLIEAKSVVENMRCAQALRRQMRDLSAMVSDEEIENFLAALKKLRQALKDSGLQ